MTNRGFVGYPAAATQPGTVLAVTQFSPAGNVTTTSATMSDIDATNLKVTFTAPSSGNVLVRLEAQMVGSGSSGYVWNLRDSVGNVANTTIDLLFGSGNPRLTATVYVTGLAPGQSYTWKWGHGLSSGSASQGIAGGGFSHTLMVVTSA